MVRILGVKDLEDRKRALITQSEMYRQTMRLELANVKYSAALLKRRFSFLKFAPWSIGALGSLVGFFFLRKRAREREVPRGAAGLLGRLRSFAKLAGIIMPLWKQFSARGRASRQARREQMTEFP